MKASASCLLSLAGGSSDQEKTLTTDKYPVCRHSLFWEAKGKHSPVIGHRYKAAPH